MEDWMMVGCRCSCQLATSQWGNEAMGQCGNMATRQRGNEATRQWGNVVTGQQGNRATGQRGNGASWPTPHSSVALRWTQAVIEWDGHNGSQPSGGCCVSETEENVQSCGENLIASSAFQGCCTEAVMREVFLLFSPQGGDYVQRGQCRGEADDIQSEWRFSFFSLGKTRSLKQLTTPLGGGGSSLKVHSVI